MLELQRVGDRRHHVRVSAEDLDAGALTPRRVPLGDEVVGRGAGRAGAAWQALNVHRRRLRRCGRPCAAPARTPRGWRSPRRRRPPRRWRSPIGRAGFRLLPMRASCRVRSRSASAAAAVQVRVRAMACRSRSDSGTPAAAALARQSAISAGDTRAWTLTVRRSAIGAPPERRGGSGFRSPASPAGPRDAGGSKGRRSAPSPVPDRPHGGCRHPGAGRPGRVRRLGWRAGDVGLRVRRRGSVVERPRLQREEEPSR